MCRLRLLKGFSLGDGNWIPTPTRIHLQSESFGLKSAPNQQKCEEFVQKTMQNWSKMGARFEHPPLGIFFMMFGTNSEQFCRFVCCFLLPKLSLYKWIRVGVGIKLPFPTNGTSPWTESFHQKSGPKCSFRLKSSVPACKANGV